MQAIRWEGRFPGFSGNESTWFSWAAPREKTCKSTDSLRPFYFLSFHYVNIGVQVLFFLLCHIMVLDGKHMQKYIYTDYKSCMMLFAATSIFMEHCYARERIR